MASFIHSLCFSTSAIFGARVKYLVNYTGEPTEETEVRACPR